MDELVDFLNRIDSGYRSELHELNERNFARFDDRLERRFVQFEAVIGERLADLDAKLTDRIEKLTDRIEKLTHRIDEVDATLSRRIDEVEAKLDRRITELDAKIEQRSAELRAEMKVQLGELQTRLAATESRLVAWMFVFVATGVVAVLGLG